MKNTANDELLVELQLQSNTYNHNKVTKTFKPKKIETAVSQKMVDEYKRDLLTQDLERRRDPAVRALIAGKPTLTDLTPLEAKHATEVYEFNRKYDKYTTAVNNLTLYRMQLDQLTAEINNESLKFEQLKSKGKYQESKGDDRKAYLGQKKKIDDLKDKKNQIIKIITKLEARIPDYQRTSDELNKKYKETETKIEATKLLNLQNITNYKKIVTDATLTTLPDQTPGEPDDDYNQRIQDVATSNITDVDIQAMMEYDQIKLLKTNFSAIFNLDRSKTLSIVESIIRQLPSSQIYELNTKWEGFKKVYSEIYGINNDNITVKLLFDLIVGYLAGPTGMSLIKPGPSGQPSATPTIPAKPVPAGPPQYSTAVAVVSPVIVLPSPDTTNPIDAYQEPGATTVITDGKNNLYYVTKFILAHKHYLGLSGSGNIGDYKIVQPWFTTLDRKGNIIRAGSLWSANNFGGGDTAAYAEFNRLYFGKNGNKIGKNHSFQYLSTTTTSLDSNKYIQSLGNAKVPANQIIGAGISIPTHDKIVNFGNVLLMYDRLLRHNMLSIKKKGGGNIENFKNVKVSDKFVDIITGALNKQNINNIYNELSEKEQELYNILVQVSNVHRYANIPKPNIKFLKDRLKIIEGEIEAGNDNLIEELTDILHTMILVKLITKKEATQHLQQYMDMNQ